MRRASRLVLLVLPLAVACGGDDDSGDDASNTTPGTTAPGDDGGMTGADGGSTAADGGPMTTDGAMGGPTIDGASWTHAEGCTMGTGSTVVLDVTATDPDNDATELTMEVLSIGCTTDNVTGLTATLTCPQLSPYMTTVTVSDPDGNSDEIEFMIDVCIDGTAP